MGPCHRAHRALRSCLGLLLCQRGRGALGAHSGHAGPSPVLCPDVSYHAGSHSQDPPAVLRGTEAGVQASSPGLGVGREGVGLPGPHVNQLYWTQLNKAFPRPVDLGGSGSQKVLEKGPSSVWGQHWTNERQESSSWPHGSSQPPPPPGGSGCWAPDPHADGHSPPRRPETLVPVWGRGQCTSDGSKGGGSQGRAPWT